MKDDEKRAQACVDVLRRNMTWDEDVDTIAELIAVVRREGEDNAKCTACRHRLALWCGHCVDNTTPTPEPRGHGGPCIRRSSLASDVRAEQPPAASDEEWAREIVAELDKTEPEWKPGERERWMLGVLTNCRAEATEAAATALEPLVNDHPDAEKEPGIVMWNAALRAAQARIRQRPAGKEATNLHGCTSPVRCGECGACRKAEGR